MFFSSFAAVRTVTIVGLGRIWVESEFDPALSRHRRAAQSDLSSRSRRLMKVRTGS